MCAGYHSDGEGENSFTDLDEFLCEYVDGTMDPAVRKAFEEYVRSEPALAEHVAQLMETRRLLCHYGHHVHAPCGLQTRLHQQLSIEMLEAQRPVLSGVAPRLSSAVALSSFLVLLFLTGLLTGPAESASEGGAVDRIVSYADDREESLVSEAAAFTDPWSMTREQVRTHRAPWNRLQDRAGIGRDTSLILVVAGAAGVRRTYAHP